MLKYVGYNIKWKDEIQGIHRVRAGLMFNVCIVCVLVFPLEESPSLHGNVQPATAVTDITS